MKKIFVFAALSVAAMQLCAQDAVNLDTYIGAQLATEDLNGTARYVGMGGAMEALGADISTIGTNPAGIGLFRHSQVSGSFGLVSQSDGKSFADGSKTNASFDQMGFVIATRTGVSDFINFGFNFHKSRNFNHVLSAVANAINGSSQNRQTYIKGLNDQLLGRYSVSVVDELCLRMMENGIDPKTGDPNYTYIDAQDYMFNRAQTGYIGEYDFNLSGNINNRFYWGLTVGLKGVHYNSYTEYEESLVASDPEVNYVKMTDSHKITGTGFNIKAGIIGRPIEESPFRLGVSVSSPTFYKLTTENISSLNDQYGMVMEMSDKADFRFNTPWVFGFSAGHIIDNCLALGLSYEYADYSTNDMRTITSSGYNWYGDYYDKSDSDPVMKDHAQRTLKGVSTIKAGAEYMIDKNISVRVGYNYVSPMYKESGVRDMTLDSPGVMMASTTDYTNWKSTNRITAGASFTFDQFRIDLAYQYQMRSGDFYPYMNHLQNTNQYYPDPKSNDCYAVDVKDNRHQLLCTLSYTF